MKRVLLIAFQYPPMAGTSGVQRALRFSQYLPEFGWEPIVLTASRSAYESKSEDLLSDVPKGIHVERALALDTSRHISLFGRYPRCLADPDRWMTWWLSAVPKGLRLIKRFRPVVLWSTFPIPTAHRIGLTLRRATGLPWVADFRDVMTEEGYPADARLAYSWRRLERSFLEASSAAVFTTPGAASLYSHRYGGLPEERFSVIENGYDEPLFAAVETIPSGRAAGPPHEGPVRLLHSGVIYPEERNPEALFQALRELHTSGELAPRDLQIVLRATGHDFHLANMMRSFGVSDFFQIAPAIDYRSALTEMVHAHGLLVLQGCTCNRQIPAKLYECFRSGRPILGLVSGDTALAMREAGIDTIAPLESPNAIRSLLLKFVWMLRSGEAPIAVPQVVRRQSRRNKAKELSTLLFRLSDDIGANGFAEVQT